VPVPAGDHQIMLGWIHYGWVRAEFMASVLALITGPEQKLIGRVGEATAGALVGAARNQLTARFLGRGAERWLLMVDTDMAFTPADVAALAAAADEDKTPLLSGLYPLLDSDGRSMFPAAYRTETRDGQITRYAPMLDLPGDGLADADGCGAGFLLVHRQVFGALLEQAGGGEPWFAEMPAPGGYIRGEDLSFCARAAAAGFPLRVHCGVRPGHLKPVMLTFP
jgi:GT2 family glycosyltransferase